MKRNCVLVMNINNVLGENSRNSIASAAGRWGADYLEVTSTPIRGHHLGVAKYDILKTLDQYDRVVHFDADMVVFCGAPNIFNCFPNNDKIYAVADVTAKFWETKSTTETCASSMATHEQRLGVSFQGGKGRYFNSGFFLCNPTRHKPLFEWVLENLPNNTTGLQEQSLFNLAVDKFMPGDLELVDYTWNCITSVATDIMNKFVYHFAGLDKGELPFQQWKKTRVMVSETHTCRHELAKFCVGSGLDIGFGGAPITPTAICIDARQLDGNHIVGDATKLSWFADNAFDFVYSSHALEDFIDTEAVLKEWWRVIKPGGHLVMFLPDEQAYRAHCDLYNNLPNQAHKHENFGLKYVKDCMTKVGNYEIVKAEFPVPYNPYSFTFVAQKPK